MRFSLKQGHKIALALVALSGVALFFQNCQPAPQFQLEAPRSAASDDSPVSIFPGESTRAHAAQTPEEAAAAPFAHGKMQISKVGGQDLGGAMTKMGSRPRLVQGERLIAVVDNHCLDQGQASEFTAAMSVTTQRLENLPTQSYAWTMPQDVDLAALEIAAENDPCLIGLSHDDIAVSGGAPSDPYLSKQLGYLAIGGSEAFDFFSDPLRGATSSIVVAVIDSGTNYNHPDLKNMLWRSDSGAYGYNFQANTNAVMDDFGHGTAVAGIIAAQTDNGIGMAGVMGHNIQIMTLKVQNSTGQAYISDIVLAIDYARSRGVQVINISMEGAGANAGLQSALNAAAAAKIFVAVAAGNSGSQISASNIIVPAYYSSIDGVMTVGSIDSVSGQRSSFSNFSTTYVEIAAPGSNGILVPDRQSGYRTDQGTSFSAPMVAGAGALVISFFKKNGISYDAATVENVIKDAAVSQSNLTSHFQSGRTLDLRALALYLQRAYLAPVDGGYGDD